MEADLQRWYHVDYRDRWRGDLSLRRIRMLITHLPPESVCKALARDGNAHWSIESHLLDDLRIVLVAAHTSKDGPKPKPNPARPKPRRAVDTPERHRKLVDARRRARERRKAIADGHIT